MILTSRSVLKIAPVSKKTFSKNAKNKLSTSASTNSKIFWNNTALQMMVLPPATFASPQSMQAIQSGAPFSTSMLPPGGFPFAQRTTGTPATN